MKSFRWLLLSLAIGVSLFDIGCASPKRKHISTDGLASAPLRPGERITIIFSADVPPTIYQIDMQGFVMFDGAVALAVQVAGLSPAGAAAKIRQIFVPRYYRQLDVRVTRSSQSIEPMTREPRL